MKRKATTSAVDNDSSALRRRSARLTMNERPFHSRTDQPRPAKRLRTLSLRTSPPSADAPRAVADTDNEFDSDSEFESGADFHDESQSPAPTTSGGENTSDDGEMTVSGRDLVQRRGPSHGAQGPKPRVKPRLPKSNADNGSPTERGLDLNFRPINDIRDMFSDLVAKACELGLGRSPLFGNRRPIRIATMCSGTESPLLACRLISKGTIFTFSLHFPRILDLTNTTQN